MKTARLLAMATGGLDVGIELETPPTPRGRNGRGDGGGRERNRHVNPASIHSVSRSHSRSASWSFTRGQVLNPITPITSVIREIVPSLSQISMATRNTTGSISIPESPRPSRTSSRESLLRGNSSTGSSRGSGEEDGEGEELDGARRDLSVDDEHQRLSPEPWESRTLGDPSANVNVHVPRGHNHNPTTIGGNQNGIEEQNGGVEINDGVRWLERNAIFIILLLVKFAWYHRSGKLNLSLSHIHTHTHTHTHTHSLSLSLSLYMMQYC